MNMSDDIYNMLAEMEAENLQAHSAEEKTS